MTLISRLRLHRQPGSAAQLNPDAERLREMLLRESELFHGLPDAELGQIAHRLPIASCSRGQLIYVPGESGETLFILKSGHVRIYRLAPDGRKLVLLTVGPGSVFGEMPSLGQSMTSSFAEAVEEATVCVMSRVDVDEILLAHPAVALRLVYLLAGRLRKVEDKLEQVVFEPIADRLAELLVALSDTSGDVAGYSHQELADMIGTSRETVSRTLQDFRSEGILDVGRRHIRLLDLAALKTRASGG